jgi:hypothetical protein
MPVHTLVLSKFPCQPVAVFPPSHSEGQAIVSSSTCGSDDAELGAAGAAHAGAAGHLHHPPAGSTIFVLRTSRVCAAL